MSDAYKLFVCVQCGFEYDESKGWPEDGIAPGTRWDEIPDDLAAPQSGQLQSSGISSQRVPGAMPSSGQPLDSSYSKPHCTHTNSL